MSSIPFSAAVPNATTGLPHIVLAWIAKAQAAADRRKHQRRLVDTLVLPGA